MTSHWSQRKFSITPPKMTSDLGMGEKLRKDKTPCQDCGAFLASDNDNFICSPCEERETDLRMGIRKKARW